MSNFCNAERQAAITRATTLSAAGLRIQICATASQAGATGIPTDGAYAPQAITLSDALDGINVGNSAVTFPVMAVNVDVAGWVIEDSNTPFTPRYWNMFTSGPVTITAGNAFPIGANALGITTAPT